MTTLRFYACAPPWTDVRSMGTRLTRFSGIPFLQISNELVAIRNSFGDPKSRRYDARSDLSDTERKKCIISLSRFRSVILVQSICSRVFKLLSAKLRPSSHPPIHPSIHLSILTSIYLSIHPPIYPSIHLFVHPFIHPSIYPFCASDRFRSETIYFLILHIVPL